MFNDKGGSWYYVNSNSNIGKYFFDNGAHEKFGLPESEEYKSGLFNQNTNQDFQMAKISDPLTGGAKSDPKKDDIKCPAVCGDNKQEKPEECDGTDTVSGLTCTNECKVNCGESNYFDTNEKVCKPNPVCGNNVVEKNEKCDGGIECSSDCKTKCADDKQWNDTDKKCEDKPEENELDESKEVDLVSIRNSYSKVETPVIIVKLGERENFWLHLRSEVGVLDRTDNVNNSNSWERFYDFNNPDHMEIIDFDKRIVKVTLPELHLWQGTGAKKVYFDIDAGGGPGLFQTPQGEDKSFTIAKRDSDYIYHRSPRGEETMAKINYAIYSNQWIDENGTKYVPNEGSYACGPTSLMSGVSGMGKISKKDYTSLRSYVFEDTFWVQEGITQVGETCSKYDGAFSRVMVSCDYLSASWDNMRTVLNKSFELSSEEYVDNWANYSFYQFLKGKIDSGEYIISGISVPGKSTNEPQLGHVILVKGYGVGSDADWKVTNTDAISAIVNDSFTDLMKDDDGDGYVDREISYWESGAQLWVPDYTLNGNGAIYQVNKNKIAFNNLLVISK